MDPSQTTQLLLSAKAGDDIALNDLYRRCGPRLLALIRLRLGSDKHRVAEPEDLAQEVLLKAFARIGDFEKDTSKSLFAWLATIASNTIRDHIAFQRREKRDVRRTSGIEAVGETIAAKHRSAISQILVDEQLQQMELSLAKMAEKERQLIFLRRFEECSFADMGRNLGMSPDAARMAYQRAMAKLTVMMAHD